MMSLHSKYFVFTTSLMLGACAACGPGSNTDLINPQAGSTKACVADDGTLVEGCSPAPPSTANEEEGGLNLGQYGYAVITDDYISIEAYGEEAYLTLHLAGDFVANGTTTVDVDTTAADAGEHGEGAVADLFVFGTANSSTSFYSLELGTLTIEVASGDDAHLRTVTVSGSNLQFGIAHMYYSEDELNDAQDYSLDLATLSLTVEGMVSLAPPAPEQDIVLASDDTTVNINHTTDDTIDITIMGNESGLWVTTSINRADLQLPGESVIVIEHEPTWPHPWAGWGTLPAGDGYSDWEFQLNGFTLTTEASALDDCSDFDSMDPFTNGVELTISNMELTYVGPAQSDSPVKLLVGDLAAETMPLHCMAME